MPKPDAEEVARQIERLMLSADPDRSVLDRSAEAIESYASRVTRDKLRERARRVREMAAARETERDHANTTAWSACCDAAMLALIEAASMLEAEAGKEGSK